MTKTSLNNSTFEIRVALIGNVSVGKSTVLNALLGAQYSEVSMRRTTAAVHNFCILDDWSMVEKKEPQTAATTLAETTMENAKHRSSDGGDVSVKTFDIALDEPVCKMRKDTKLVLVDIPGANDTDISRRFREFVKESWHTFDIAVFVMDGDVSAKEHVSLLELAKGLNETSRKIPLIILCNKIDDPDEKEQQVIVDEARQAVESVFGPMEDQEEESDLAEMPAFIAVSALHAFIYRYGSRLSYEEFQSMDEDFIEKLGKESYGRQWRRFSEEKKLEMAFRSVSDPEQCLDGVEASNFDTFIEVLSLCIGDENHQLVFVEEQFTVSLKRLELEPHDNDIVAELTGVYKRLDGIKRSTAHLPDRFWNPFELIKKKAFEEFLSSKQPDALAKPMRLLTEYANLVKVTKWDGELDKVALKAKDLVLEQAVDVLDRDKFVGDMSAQDQSLIFGSMMLFANRSSFSENFGRLKLALDARYIEAKVAQLNSTTPQSKCEKCNGATTELSGADYCAGCGYRWIDKDVLNCPYCGVQEGAPHPLADSTDADPATRKCVSDCGFVFALRTKARSYDVKCHDGELVPANKALFDKSTTVAVPDSPKDPKHFGHLIWSCCNLLEKIDGSK